MDVNLVSGGVLEESTQLLVEVASIDYGCIDHNGGAIKCPHRQRASGELLGQLVDVLGRRSGVFMQEDRAARSVRTVDGERIVGDKEEGFANLCVAKALPTWVIGTTLNIRAHVG